MTNPGKESEALVLGCRDHGESDKIVTFYSRNAGRFTGIAKGANRSKRRFVNKLELFSFLNISYLEPKGQGLSFIQEAELHNSFLLLRQDYQLYTIASVIQEILLVSLDEKEEDQKVFLLILWALHSLDSRRPPAAILQFFLIRYFDLLGYRPNLSACLSCGVMESSTQRFSFDSTTGGLVCNKCKHPEAASLTPLSPGTIKVLTSALTLPLEKLHRLKLSGKLLDETSTMLHRYGRLLFQRDFHAWRMYNSL